MSRAAGTLKRLERQAARRAAGRVLPIKILSYEDGLYSQGGRTYTQEEVTALETEYQLVIICWEGEEPPGHGRQIQMTWGNDASDGDAA